MFVPVCIGMGVCAYTAGGNLWCYMPIVHNTVDSLTGGNEQGAVIPEYISSLCNVLTQQGLTVLALVGESSALETCLGGYQNCIPFTVGHCTSVISFLSCVSC